MWHFHTPNAAFRGPTGSSTEGPSGTIRKRPETPIVAFSPTPSPKFRGPVGNSTEGPSATVRM
eukprot:6718227-Pyramimonas_sp.AAC.1